MAYLLKLPTFNDESGTLTVIEDALPFNVKRFYYVYDVHQKRGGHRHKKSEQALICLGGACDIYVNNGIEEQLFALSSPEQCLIVKAEDWHTMDNFSKGSALMVFASTCYDVDDYIDEPY